MLTGALVGANTGAMVALVALGTMVTGDMVMFASGVTGAIGDPVTGAEVTGA